MDKLTIFILSILLSVNVAAGSKLYFTQMPDSIPGNYTVWSYDTSSKQVTAIATDLEEAYTGFDMVSGAAICGSEAYYYAVASDLTIAHGVLVTDVAAGTSKILDSKLFDGNLLHNMWCDPADSSGQTLYAIEYNVEDTKDSDYYLYHVTVEGSKVTNEKLGAFVPAAEPTGSDTMFSATKDVSEVWCGWSLNSNEKQGKIQIMSTKTGQVTDEYALSGHDAYPYVTVPYEAHQKTFLGVMNNPAKDVRTAQFTLEENGSVSVDEVESAPYAYTGSQPWAIEYSKDLAHAVQSYESVIRTMNAKTGELVEDIPFSEILNDKTVKAGALAVVDV